jgi:membrane dipeptidase
VSPTPTFDYAAGTPWVVTDAVEAAVDEAVAAGDAVGPAMQAAVTREFREDPAVRERVQAAYRDAGVDLVSVTVTGKRDALAGWQARFDAADWLQKVRSPAQARAVAAEDGAVGVVLNTQNLGRDVGDDVAAVEHLYNAGVRVFQPTYNPQNLLGAGCYARSDCGLSAAGAEAVRRLGELGAVVDVSHCGRATSLDAVDVADGPVAATHVGCAAVADHPRCKDDAVLAAVADAGGYVGIVGVPWFLAPDAEDPSLEVYLEHLDHAVNVVGPDGVGLGTDFAHVDAAAPDRYLQAAREAAVEAGFPEGYGEGYGSGFGAMRSYTDWPVLRERIEARYDDDVAAGILGENFLAFWERVAG